MKKSERTGTSQRTSQQPYHNPKHFRSVIGQAKGFKFSGFPISDNVKSVDKIINIKPVEKVNAKLLSD